MSKTILVRNNRKPIPRQSDRQHTTSLRGTSVSGLTSGRDRDGVSCCTKSKQNCSQPRKGTHQKRKTEESKNVRRLVTKRTSSSPLRHTPGAKPDRLGAPHLSVLRSSASPQLTPSSQTVQKLSVLRPTIQSTARSKPFQSLLTQVPQRRATLARIPDTKSLGFGKRGRLPSRRYSENLLTGLRLRKRQSQADVYAMMSVKTVMPLVRFKKAVRTVVLLLRAIYTDRERRQRRERQLNIWIDMSDAGLTSRRAYETYGLTFDPQDFKANRQIQVTAEARTILSMNTGQRSNQQIHSVLVSLRQAVPEFSEFPITMQESLARVGWYEKFEAKRVIIRQGHMADNFYFILSGTAVVIILETDKMTGEQKARTAAILGKGKSFGELALMHKARRSATVTCREEVELLAVGRDDFVDIFMHVERGVEPEHVRFLRGLPIFKGWPLQILPFDDPKVLLFTYVRRGVVLCHDSNTSDWIFVIKSGHCRIIKCLPLVPKTRARARPTRLLRRESTEFSNSFTPFSTSSDLSFDLLSPTHAQNMMVDSQKEHLPFVRSRSLNDQKKTALLHVQTLDAILEQKHSFDRLKMDNRNSEKLGQTGRFVIEGADVAPIFVQVLKLGAKDVFGLEATVFDTMSTTVGTSLVSDGAELIMINRKFFVDNTSSDLKKYIRKEIHPLPSEDSLQTQLKTQMEWENYRNQTLQKTMGTMRLVESLHR